MKIHRMKQKIDRRWYISLSLSGPIETIRYIRHGYIRHVNLHEHIFHSYRAGKKLYPAHRGYIKQDTCYINLSRNLGTANKFLSQHRQFTQFGTKIRADGVYRNTYLIGSGYRESIIIHHRSVMIGH